MTTGQKISYLRRKKSITQEALSASMGVSRQSISAWESDAVLPSTEQIVKLSKTLGVTIDYLLTDKELDETVNKNKKNLTIFTSVSYGLIGLQATMAVVALIITFATYKAWIGFTIYVIVTLLSLIASIVMSNIYRNVSEYTEEDSKAIERTKIASIFGYVLTAGFYLPIPLTDFLFKQSTLLSGGVVYEPSLVGTGYLLFGDLIGLLIALGVSLMLFYRIERKKISNPSNLWWISLLMSVPYLLSTFLFATITDYDNLNVVPSIIGAVSLLALPLIFLFIGKRMDLKLFLGTFIPGFIIGLSFVPFPFDYATMRLPLLDCIYMPLLVLYAAYMTVIMIKKIKEKNNAFIFPTLVDIGFAFAAIANPFVAKGPNTYDYDYPILIAAGMAASAGVICFLAVLIRNIAKRKKA